MKSTLKVALLATVMMAAPVFAADVNTDDTHAMRTDGRAIDNSDNVKLDANGNPVHHKHWHHHHKDNGDAAMNDHKYINHDANPNYAAVDGHHGYRDADGNWHEANGTNMHHGYRDANGNWHQGDHDYVANGGYRDANGNWHNGMSRDYAYNDYYNRSADGRWMGIDFNSRHMTDGADTDVNNRGRHAFIFDDGQNPQDFRVGSGHVVKF